ncbi:Aste57867_5063 [Aphanomyces stellatus]|uniref:subtilisin n=1 Tax=Aphanomyces stellatus TaxID=120398 RepID=A0A485KEW9_9STRA|nr:hypothetical protein As57867_005050 [Aphanomyces stellatus]VFT82144.1 Aste57867_5063 [Aphanomyces stellatus]
MWFSHTYRLDVGVGLDAPDVRQRSYGVHFVLGYHWAVYRCGDPVARAARKRDVRRLGRSLHCPAHVARQGCDAVAPIGESGPQCGTANSIGGYTRIIGVGSTGSYSDDPTVLTPFSAKGLFFAVDPVIKRHVVLVKPDISAPTMDTLSADYENVTGYVTDGSGVVALLKSAKPDLTPDEIYTYLTRTADRASLNTTEPAVWYDRNRIVLFPGVANCGGIPYSSWPNNHFGYGQVNVAAILSTGSLIDLP